GSRHEPPLRERLREATRQAILAAAEQTFGERGIHATRMEDVASRAGVAVGTLYNYFSDKKHVITALLDRNRAELVSRLDAAMAPAASASDSAPSLRSGVRAQRLPFEEMLAAWFDAILAHIEAHRALFVAFLEEAGGVQQKSSSTLDEVMQRATRI